MSLNFDHKSADIFFEEYRTTQPDAGWREKAPADGNGIEFLRPPPIQNNLYQ